MFKNTAKFLIIAALCAAAGAAWGLKFYSDWQIRSFDGKITTLQKQISELGQKITTLTGEQQKAVLPAKEVVQREVIREKSQDELLTAAVARITPAVVSIVVSKDVPLLEVTYVNPFGDDPFFKDFGVQVPVYQQKGTQKQKVGAGTGFLIAADGYIITNRHVVEDTAAEYTVLLTNGRQLAGRVVYRDQQQDLAIVKVEGAGYASVDLGDSSTLKLGQAVAAIGNALGEYNNSVSVGIVSGLDRSIEASSSVGTEKLTGVIQTDAAINPGNSGGPLFDLSGKVVGVNVATVVGSNNISFSIPVNSVKEVLKRILGR